MSYQSPVRSSHSVTQSTDMTRRGALRRGQEVSVPCLGLAAAPPQSSPTDFRAADLAEAHYTRFLIIWRV